MTQEDSTNANLPQMYEDSKTGAEVASEVAAALEGKALQWESEAAVELTKKAGDRGVYNALTWAADQLRMIAHFVEHMEQRIWRDTPSAVEQARLEGYDDGFHYATSMLFTQTEVDALVEAAIEEYERERAPEPFVPNPEVLNSNAEVSTEAPEPGTEFVSDGQRAEVVEPGSDDDPFAGEVSPEETKEAYRAVLEGYMADEDWLDRVVDIRQFIIDHLDQEDLDAFDETVKAAKA